MKEKQTAEEIACKKYSIKEGLNDYEENHFNSTNVNLAKAFIEGYTQCQENMQKLMDDYQTWIFTTTEPLKSFKQWLDN
jgi:hypothetical protein